MQQVTHARIKYKDDNFVTFVPVESIKEFKKKMPKNKNDFDVNKYYTGYWEDPKSKIGIYLPVQVCQLACGTDDLKKIEKKRAVFKKLSESIFEEYENADSEDEQTQNVEKDKNYVKNKKRSVIRTRSAVILKRLRSCDTIEAFNDSSNDSSDNNKYARSKSELCQSTKAYKKTEQQTLSQALTAQITKTPLVSLESLQNQRRPITRSISKSPDILNKSNKSPVLSSTHNTTPHQSSGRSSNIPTPELIDRSTDSSPHISSGISPHRSPDKSPDIVSRRSPLTATLPQQSSPTTSLRSETSITQSENRSSRLTINHEPTSSRLSRFRNQPNHSANDRIPLSSVSTDSNANETIKNNREYVVGNKRKRKSVTAFLAECVTYYKASEGHGAEEKENRYKKLNDKEIYLGEDKTILSIQWDLMQLQKPIIFLRDLAVVLWGAHDLSNRALDLSKTIQAIPGRSPVKLIEKNLLRLLISLYNDYLAGQKDITPRAKTALLKSSLEILKLKIRDLRGEEKKAVIRNINNDCRRSLNFDEN